MTARPDGTAGGLRLGRVASDGGLVGRWRRGGRRPGRSGRGCLDRRWRARALGRPATGRHGRRRRSREEKKAGGGGTTSELEAVQRRGASIHRCSLISPASSLLTSTEPLPCRPLLAPPASASPDDLRTCKHPQTLAPRQRDQDPLPRPRLHLNLAGAQVKEAVDVASPQSLHVSVDQQD